MSRCQAPWLACLVLGAVLLPLTKADAQATNPPITQIELKAGDKVPVANQPATGGVDPIRCDPLGNVYMRPVSGKTRALVAPILRISTDGHSTTVFDVSNLPEIKEAKGFEIYDFAIRKNGEILELAGIVAKEGDPYAAVIQVDEGDKTASLIRIDSHFSPRQVAPMPSGMFLLSGIQYTTQLQGTQFRQSTKPFTAIFDSRGRLVKEVQLPGDVKIEDIDPSKTEKPDISNLQAVDLSRFIVADDGSIFMLRSGPRPKVYLISPAGEVVRSFQVTMPAEDASPSSIFYSGGRIGFDFYVPGAKDDPRMKLVIRMVDPQDGQILWDYVPAKDIYGIPACYSGQDFTFLTSTTDRRLALLKVSPH